MNTRLPRTLASAGHIRFAKLSLTMMVLSLSGPPLPSLLLKNRPSFSRMPMAMKYSGDARQIGLCCSRLNGDAVVSVTDHGIGIASADQPRIFDKFYRVRSSHTDLIAGTGLGLKLVRHIVQAHSGSVDVQSELGRGSTFSIRIPVSHEVSA